MPKFHQLSVKDIRQETNDTVSVAFNVPASLKDEYQFLPGQYLTLRAMLKGEDVRRSYSICSAPHEGELRVAIKKVEDGRFSTYANVDLKTGDELDVMTPIGNFHPKDNGVKNKQYVAFASGSGITPVISIIKSQLNKDAKSQFILFYGNKNFDSIIFREELEALKNIYLDRFSLYHVMSRETLGAPIFNGRIDEEKLKTFAKVFFDPQAIDEYFICGPEQMIHTVKNTLAELQVPKDKVHFELFTSPVGSLAPKAKKKQRDFDPKVESKVQINLDGDSFDFVLSYGGDNILDAALKSGADLPFACKGGVCCTCRAKLVEGEIEMDVNYALEQEEVDAGFILTCQAHPRTEKVVVDFDQK